MTTVNIKLKLLKKKKEQKNIKTRFKIRKPEIYLA